MVYTRQTREDKLFDKDCIQYGLLLKRMSGQNVQPKSSMVAVFKHGN